MRIVSLLPSATDIVCKLGFEDHLVARSHECDYSEYIRNLPVVTEPKVGPSNTSREIDRSVKTILESGLSLFEVDAEKLAEIDPDIIITQDHCEACAVSFEDVRDAYHRFSNGDAEILSLSPTDLNEIFKSIQTVGEVLEAADRARHLLDEIKQRLDIIHRTAIGEPEKQVLSIEWLDPVMTGGNWIPELIEIAGGIPLLAEPGTHSPFVNWIEILEADPDTILLMPCGYEIEKTVSEMDTLAKNETWNQLSAVKNGQVYVLDGNKYFNRPGPAIYESARILGEILHPDLFKPKHRFSGWIEAGDYADKDKQTEFL